MNKDCAFQYAYEEGYKTNFKEDTGLITIEEAKKLWREYLPDFIYRLEHGYKPEMALWVGMEDETDYHQTMAHVNSATETDGKRLFETKKIYIDV